MYKTNKECQLILMDSDAGIDDAWAILMVLAAAKDSSVQLMGVTCVFGNSNIDQTCINVLRTLESCDRLDIPVFKGASSPLIFYDKSVKTGFFGSDGFGSVTHNTTPDMNIISEENGVEALNRIVCENKDKITLICLGPLTNVALAIRTYPCFVNNVKEILIMGGNYKGIGNATDCAEFNFYADPEAAHIVLNSAIEHKVLVPWETCCNLKFSLDWRDNMLGAGKNVCVDLMNYVERPLRVKASFVEWMPCDQVAAAVALSRAAMSESFTTYVTVELAGRHTRGQVVVTQSIRSSQNTTIVTKVNQQQLAELLLNVHSL